MAGKAPDLDVRDLQVVLALASTGSTAAAGSVLHLTQSAVSRALVNVESKLGVRVFERTSRGLSPTERGERLIDAAGPLLARFADVERLVREPEVTPARMRLVCECYTAYRWLPSTILRLRERIPGFEVTLAIEHGLDPVRALVAGEIDVALLTTSAVPRGLRERPLFSDEIVFVMAASHPLAQRPSLTAADLKSTTLVSGGAGPAEIEWFQRAAFGSKRPKLDFLRFPLTEAIVDAARAGLGVAVLSEWIASGYLGGDDLVVRRFSPKPLRRPWRIAFRDDTAEAAMRLATAIEGAGPRIYADARRA
jgi:LysR family transcriptional regulator for metE and metH